MVSNERILNSDELSYMQKILKKYNDEYTKDAELIAKKTSLPAITDEDDFEKNEVLKLFAAMYSQRYGHSFDPNMDYKASALAIFFIYGLMIGRAWDEITKEEKTNE